MVPDVLGRHDLTALGNRKPEAGWVLLVAPATRWAIGSSRFCGGRGERR
jgi:hypothetical protein